MMRDQRSVVNRRRVGRNACAALAPIVVALAACSPQVSSHGRDHMTAAYSLGTLTCNLGDDVRVPAIMAAAEGALRGRGYSISSKASTDDRGRIYARAPRESQIEGVSIEARVTSAGHEVVIHVDPLGDDARSRVLLDDVLARLGR
jgi:hypothetical protein